MSNSFKPTSSSQQIDHLAEILNPQDLFSTETFSNVILEPFCEDMEEKETLVALLQAIKPQDITEAILASQFILLHLKGFKVMEQNYANSKGHSMAMIRLSHQALDMLQRYRGKSQTINVNYNILNKGNAFLNTK